MKWRNPEQVVRVLAARHPRLFWLDGVVADPRRSIVGWLEPSDTSLAVPAGRDPFAPTAQLLDDLQPHERLVGWFGYAARTDLPATRADGPVPDSLWMRASRYLVFDHEAVTVTPVGFDDVPDLRGADLPEDAPHCATEVARWPVRDYREAFDRVQEALRRGDTYETNLTYRVGVRSDEAPLGVYRRLRRLNPSPYAAYLQYDGIAVLSSSPERFARIEGGEIETRPIKGTTPRSDDRETDAAHARMLTTDPRLRAENLIITDLLRNDLSVVCEPGTVTVPDLMRVESYASVHQLVTTVRGRLRLEVGVVDAVRELSPAGSMTGAPKLRTMQLIADVESTPRGVYSGCLGWMGPGSADLAVVIRTLVHDGATYVAGTGGGITVASDAGSEHAEAEHKVSRLLLALGARPLLG
jgi:anthranilate/para-aminobenzoate synthase component I